MGLAVGLLLGAAIPAVALSTIDAKQNRKIRALKARVAVIENAPDTTTGLADEVNNLKDRANWADANINHLYNKTNNLDGNGVYYGVVRRWQVFLGDNDECVNAQPRNATWNNSRLSC